ncbi:baseplate assembly protein [Mannheimia indoligenes]|uniref:baseplate assembly protein n=1 Tax=Mannheimia indoligenes TaxID=3103145 RepID=UPI002FE69C53
MSEIVDLSKLPAPKVLEELDYETLLEERKEKFLSLYKNEGERAIMAARLELESEPITKLLEENAYLELLLRSQINDRAKAVMLAFATGSDLDHLGALFGVERLLIQAENLTTNPITEAEYENDERFRTRIQMSLEKLTTAGSRGSYEYHTLTASPLIKDVNVYSPIPGTVVVILLSKAENGIADSNLINKVRDSLNDERVRPLTDTVQVKSAEILNYQINADITLYPSVLERIVMDNVQNAVKAYTLKQHHLGLDITLSGIYAAIHQEGIQNVVLSSPAQNIVVNHTQAAYCTEITINVVGKDE